MYALQREGFHPSLPQQPGDGRGAAHGDRQHRQMDQFRAVKAWGRPIEEKQRRASDRDRGTGCRRRHAAERTCESDDADEQRREIRNSLQVAVGNNREQRHRRHERRTGHRAPVELHAFLVVEQRLKRST